MTTPAIGPTTRHYTRPFMTNGMYRQFPTGLALDGIVSGGQPGQQDAELARIILLASQECNSFCYGASGGVLHATNDTQTIRVQLNRWGEAKLNPRFTPVIALTALSYGIDGAAMTALTDLTHVEVEPTRIIVPMTPFTGMSSQGPLQFGRISTAWEMRVDYSYDNGFPLTSLVGAVSAGATTFSVTDATGIYAGRTYLTIRDPINGDESFTVTSVTGTTIGCPALAYAHDPTTQVVQVDGLPQDVINACGEMTSGLLERRDQNTKRPSGRRSSNPQLEGETGPGEDNFARAYDLLRHFVQVRDR